MNINYQRFTKKEVVSRTRYILTATLEMQSEHSLLVKKANSNTRFWIDKNGFDCDYIVVGTEADFFVNINTYIGQSDENRIIKTKLRLVDVDLASDDLGEDKPEFRGGTMNVSVKNVVRTEMNGLFLLFLEKESTGERIWARYFNEDSIGPITERKYSCNLNLVKSKSAISVDGMIFEGTEEKLVVNDEGVKVKNVYPVYVPYLEVTSLTPITPKVEGDGRKTPVKKNAPRK